MKKNIPIFLVMLVALDALQARGSGLTPLKWSYKMSGAGSKYGWSVAPAGDVNGDGYGDVVIGASEYDRLAREAGCVDVFMGSGDGLSASVDKRIECSQEGAWFGFDVAPAGDVNGDGYSDVIVGAPLYDHEFIDEGAAFLYLGSKNGISARPAWVAYGAQEDAKFGHSLFAAGDVNHDGYDDIIIGAPRLDGGFFDSGKVFVYLGSDSGLASDPAWTAEGGVAEAMFGYSVASAGDVNRDGYDDIIVSAKYDGSVAKAGRVYLFLGSAEGPSPSPDWTGETGEEGALFGFSVCGAGDVNGDGFADVLIGAPEHAPSGSVAQGMIYVYFGSGQGLASEPSWQYSYGNLDLFGYSVSPAGDVDGDGFADILAGSSLGDFAMLIPGSPAGPDPSAKWIEQKRYGYGASLSGAGDVNGDGFSDVIIGAYMAGGGSAYAYHGKALAIVMPADPAWADLGDQAFSGFGKSVAYAGDVNGDGYGDLVSGGYLADGEGPDQGVVRVYLGGENGFNPNPDVEIHGRMSGGWFGWAVSSAGDVNGDGYDDVLVGAPRFSESEMDEGAVYLFCGSAEGLETEPSRVWRGSRAGAELGFSVARAGDLNGDGFCDVAAGAFRYDGGEEDEGAVFIFYGSPWGLLDRPSVVLEGGQAGAWFGYAVSGAGDVNGDGYSDILVGAPMYDTSAGDEGAAFLFLGSADGLRREASWSVFADQRDSRFGVSVAGAGDVNGDGFADIMVGADEYWTDLLHRGIVYLYQGSVDGPSVVHNWRMLGEHDRGMFGASIAAAGDVNGDGLSDVMVGDPLHADTSGICGKVDVYKGTKSGLAASPIWTFEGNGEGSFFGESLAGIASASGDGTWDMVVGAPGEGAVHEIEGAIYLFASGGAISGYIAPRQLKADGSAPVGFQCLSGQRNSFMVEARCVLPMGEEETGLEWEVKPYGVPFDGAGRGRSPWADALDLDSLPKNKVRMRVSIPGLSPATAYHWRLRQRHHNVFLPRHSRWVYPSGSRPGEQDIRIGLFPPDPRTLPVVLDLEQNYPNPFNPPTTIVFSLSREVSVNLSVYDVAGRRVKTLSNRREDSGRHSYTWGGLNDAGQPVASGVYFLVLEAEGKTAARKMVLVR